VEKIQIRLGWEGEAPAESHWSIDFENGGSPGGSPFQFSRSSVIENKAGSQSLEWARKGVIFKRRDVSANALYNSHLAKSILYLSEKKKEES